MLQPDITIKTNEQLISLCSENKLLGNLIEVPSSQKGGDPILVNLTGEIRVSENDVLPQLFNFFRGSLLPRLKTFLVDLSMEWVNITARPFIFLMPITSDFENHSPVDNVLLKYALLSPNTRKSPKGYLKTIDDLGDREAMTARIVDEVMAQPNWADSLSPQTINKIEVDLLPALLLSNEHNIKHRGAKGLLEILLGNIDRVSDLKKKDADNPLVSLLGDGNLVFSTDGLKVSDRYQSSWLRNLYLRTITYGSELKLWLPPVKNYKRLQFRCIGDDKIDDAIRNAVNSKRHSILTSLWSRLLLPTSTGKSTNLPIQLRMLGDYIMGGAISNKCAYKSVITSLVNLHGVSYDIDSCEPVRKQAMMDSSVVWYDRYNAICNEYGDIIEIKSKAQTTADDVIAPLPKDWREALAIYNEAKLNSDDYKSEVMVFVKWAVAAKNALSPWDITPTDLMNPLDSLGESGTFFSYVENDSKLKSRSTKNTRWGLARSFYRLVANALKLKGDAHISPFEDLPDVDFTGRRKKRKTPRARIPSSIIDEMLQVLCSFNEQGIPTYSWAEKVSLEALNSDYRQNRSDHYKGVDGKYIFCPSRAASLAVLLSLPIRGVQSRWLDQGLFDYEIFDLDTKSFVDNTSPLKDFKNEFGKKNSHISGIDTGVIQPAINSVLGNNSSFSIYINTNKTQLWNPNETHGYHIPWPYIHDAKLASELKMNYPYEIIFEQLRWLKEHSPDPVPVRFDYIVEDRGRITNARNVIANVPFFVPIFRDLTSNANYTRDGDIKALYNPPISKNKIETMFDEVCAETQKRLRAKGVHVDLVNDDGESVFDIHTLRVAGISNLIDMGVPLYIVSEFIAGHATPVMTLSYNKTEHDTIQKAIFSSAKNTSPSASDAVLMGNNTAKLIQPNISRNNTLPVINLGGKNVATFAPVEGGVCPLGGKGCAGCKEGMIVSDNTKEPLKPVEGGCGNCVYWLTSSEFMTEQVLELNRIMFVMKERGYEIKGLSDEIEELEWEIEDATSPSEKQALSIKITNITNMISGIEEDLMPMVQAWSNRYLAILQSEDQLQSTDKPLLIGTSNFKTSLKSSTGFELARSIVEQSHLLPRGAAPKPENPTRMLREFLDHVLCNTSAPILFARIKDKTLADKKALAFANYLNEHFTQKEIEQLHNGDLSALEPYKVEDFNKACAVLDKLVGTGKTRNNLLENETLRELGYE